MVRKLVWSFLALLLLCACLFFYLRLRKEKEPEPNAMLAIPTDATFVIESRQTQSLFRNSEGSNIIWQDLKSIPSFSSLRNTLHELDSLLATNERLRTITEGHPLFISAHPSESGLDFLCSFSIPENGSSRIIDFLSASYVIRSKQNGISSINTAQRNEICFFSINKGILLISTSEHLIQKAIDQRLSKQSLLDNPAFQSVLSTAKSSRFDLRIFLHFPGQNFWPQPFLNESFASSLSGEGGFAEWVALDASIRPQSILFNGFCSVQPTANYLNLFHDQNPQPIEAVSAMPSSTASFIHFGYSNFPSYFQAYNKTRTPIAQARLDSINKKYETDLGAEFSSWIETETVSLLCEGEPETADSIASPFVILRSDHMEHAAKNLDELCASVCKHDSVKNDTVMYGHHVIRQLKIRGLFPLLLGSAYAVNQNYYTSIDNYFIFGNSVSSLQRYLRLVDSDHTLSKDSHYNKFSSNLASKSNICFYTNIARSRSIYPAFSSTELGNSFRQQTDLLLKFEALGVQFTSRGDLFYTSSYLEENPLYKKETTSLWETHLDTVFHFRPQLLINHLNNTLDIFVQDESNKIYLISNTGKILWSKSLPEKIMSPVYQVDAFKNNKLQILFNSRSHLYLIDRNGKDLDGFPVSIPSGASNGLALMDYEHKNEYRILVACSDKHIRNFTVKGKAVEGWKDPVSDDSICAQLLHTVAAGKDYLLVADIKGKVYVFDRHGENQIRFKDKLPYPLNTFSLAQGKDPSHTFLVAADSLGNITRISMTGKTEHIPFKKFNTNPYFLYEDMNGDKNPEYIFMDGNELSVFTQDKSLLFSYTFSDTISKPPFFILNPDGHGQLGVVSESNGELYLLNESGTQPQGFPLKGKIPFSIGDINHNNTFQLITGEGKNIYVYALP
jgi:hypothetical protein